MILSGGNNNSNNNNNNSKQKIGRGGGELGEELRERWLDINK